MAKVGVRWGFRVRRECLSGYFKASPEAFVELFVELDSAPGSGERQS